MCLRWYPWRFLESWWFKESTSQKFCFRTSNLLTTSRLRAKSLTKNTIFVQRVWKFLKASFIEQSIVNYSMQITTNTNYLLVKLVLQARLFPNWKPIHNGIISVKWEEVFYRIGLWNFIISFTISLTFTQEISVGKLSQRGILIHPSNSEQKC